MRRLIVIRRSCRSAASRYSQAVSGPITIRMVVKMVARVMVLRFFPLISPEEITVISANFYHAACG